jgi:hypothetical protein
LPPFQYDDGFDTAHRPGRAQELSGILQSFHVKEDAAHVTVAAEIIDEKGLSNLFKLYWLMFFSQILKDLTLFIYRSS